MENKKIEQQLIDFIDGTLNDEQRQEVQNYIDTSETNKKEYEELKALVDSFNEVEEAQPSTALRNNFHEMLAEEKQLHNQKLFQSTERKNSFNGKELFK